MGSSKPQTVTLPQQSTTKSEPWAQQQPYLERIFGEAERAYDTLQPQYYPGNTVAGFNPVQLSAYQGILNQSQNAAPIFNAAYNAVGSTAAGDNTSPLLTGNFNPNSPEFDFLSGTARGDYLGGNPYNSAMYEAASRPVIQNWQESVVPTLTSQFAKANRFGSGAQANVLTRSAEGLGRTLGDMSANIFGTDYARERSNQLNAASTLGNAYRSEAGMMDSAYRGAVQDRLSAAAMASPLFQGSMQPYQSALTVGKDFQELDAATIQDAINRWQYAQDIPWNNLGRFQQLVQGNYGGTSQTTGYNTAVAPGGSNPIMQGLGVGAQVASLFI